MVLRQFISAEDRAEIGGQLEKWASFILANILWAIFSLPLVTLPAATAGLFAVMSKRARNEPVELFSEFFGTMRRLWLKASMLMVISGLVGGFLVFNLSILVRMDMADPVALVARSTTLFAAALLLLTSLYAWSLLVLVDLPLRGLIESSVRLVFSYPLWSVGVLVVAIVPVGISLLLPMGVFLLVTASASVWVITAGTWRVIKRHITLAEGEIAAN